MTEEAINQIEEQKPKTILVTCYDTEIEDMDALREYCDCNVDEDTIYDYVEDNYGSYVDIGPCSYDTRDVIRNCGDIDDFRSDYIEGEFEYLNWEYIEEYDDGDQYEVCGLTFSVKKIVPETPEQKAEREKREAEEELANRKASFETTMRSLLRQLSVTYPDLVSIETIMPIVCTEVASIKAEKEASEAQRAQEVA